MVLTLELTGSADPVTGGPARGSRIRKGAQAMHASHRAGLHRVVGVGAARDAQPRRPRLVRGRVQPRQAVRRGDPRRLSKQAVAR